MLKNFNINTSKIHKFKHKKFKVKKKKKKHCIHFPTQNQKHPFTHAHKKAETFIQPEAQLPSLLVQEEEVVLQVCTMGDDSLISVQFPKQIRPSGCMRMKLWNEIYNENEMV